MKKIILISILALLIINTFSCSDDLDDIGYVSHAQVNDFIWKGLNSYYLWQQEVPDLSDNKLINRTEYFNFINSFTKPTAFFTHLKFSEDRFSVIYDDYNTLEALLSGTNKTNGVDYGINRKQPNSNELFGWVRYIMPNSDASTKNIQRGDLFYAVNGTRLTIDNYRQLLAQDNYTLNLADFNNGNITPNGQSVALTKTAYNENPIYNTNVFTHNEKKIGYLMYNGFLGQYENQLNQVFSNFIAQGVTHLIIDLRYNSGGSVNTCARLAAMINNTFTNQVFVKQQWNQKVFNFYNSQNNLEIFNTKFPTTTGTGQTINSLGLNHIFFITSKSSASASELLIHNLKPFINVTQIGDVTTGKNVGSILLYDSPNFSKNNSKLNPNHRYAMLPIVFKSADRNGNGDYAQGIQPQISYIENFENLGVLGDETDPLLHITLEHIRGRSINLSTRNQLTEQISDNKTITGVPGMVFENFIFE